MGPCNHVFAGSVAKLCLILCDPMDCSPPGSSVHRFPSQEYWNRLPFPSPGDLPYPGNQTHVSCIAGRFFITKPLGKPRVITGVLKSRSRGRRRLDVRVMKCEKDSTDYWWLWSWKQATSQGMQAVSWNWKGREMDFLRASKKEHSPVETLAQGKPHQTYNLQNYKIMKVYCFKSLSLW